MKFIEQLRRKHKGEEIWVIGAGPSMDNYPLDFFGDKICIGSNWVFSAFVDIGDEKEKFSYKKFYSVHEHRPPADWIVEHIPSLLKDCFFLLPPRRIQRGRSKMVWWEDYNDDPYYMKWGLRGPKLVQATKKDFETTVYCIMKGKKRCEYVARGTTLHWAIQAAAVLGAKKIFLTGASTRGGYMLKHGSMYAQYKGINYQGKTITWRTGTKDLVNAFRPHRVEVVRYYYDKGEQAI